MRKFVDSRNNGLDKVDEESTSTIAIVTHTQVIPRSVLERAAGFAIYTVVKAGFVFSARAGSGVVTARLDDGSGCFLATLQGDYS